jgi:C_GCAxxG_C_C family probable redox protein
VKMTMSQEKAQEAFANMAASRMNCAQAVLSSFCEEFGLARQLALKLAQGFGGGMARHGRTCGAVTGAYMVLGLSRKNATENPRESLEKTYALISEFNRRFGELHGSVICRELIGHDLSAPEGLAQARESGIFTVKCPEFVSDAVKIVEDLLKT